MIPRIRMRCRDSLSDEGAQRGGFTPRTHEASADPLISVVTVVFNGAAGIEATLRSAFSQDPTLYEMIVIDGGSTDGTLAILDRYRERLAVCISEPDRGIYDAMNKGVSHARGEWLYFLNCGDHLLNSEILAKVAPSLHRAKASLVVGRVNYMAGTRLLKQLPDSVPEKNTARKLFWSHFCHQALFVRRAACIAAGGFDMRFAVYADFHNAYQVIREGGGFERIDLTIAEFDFYGVSGDFRRARELYREVEEVFASLGEPRGPVAFRIGWLRMHLYRMREALKARLSR
jgi:glycosyltransferase involved in cell wall biosynthesis